MTRGHNRRQKRRDLQLESNTELAITDTDEASDGHEGLEQSAEDVMNAYLEAYKNLDFIIEALLPFVTGTAREQVESNLRILSKEA